MKKALTIAAALALLLSFAACTRGNNNADPGTDGSPSVMQTPTPTPTLTPSATPEPSPTPTAGTETAGASVEEIWGAIETELGDTLPNSMELDGETMLSMTGVDPEKCQQYLYKFPTMNVNATEFFIGECKDGEVEAVKEQLIARQEALVDVWERYLPEQYELVKNYKLAEHGNYVFFCVAEKAEEAVAVFDSFFE